MHDSDADATWGPTAHFHNNQFFNFYPNTVEGKRQTVFCLSKTSYNYVQPHTFWNTKFTNVSPDALAYFRGVNKGSANPKDCGEFPCTGENNALFSFWNTKYLRGSTLMSKNGKDFQIISNNKGVSPYLDTCKKVKPWNAYICNSKTLGIMLFESMDGDKKDRSMQPIYIGVNGT